VVRLKNSIEFGRDRDCPFLCQCALQGTPPLALFTTKDGGRDELLQSHQLLFRGGGASVPAALATTCIIFGFNGLAAQSWR
jgi:hypothetical protein